MNTQSIVVPSGFFTVIVIDPCGSRLELGQRARDFLLRLHVEDASERMMHLERGTAHQTPASQCSSIICAALKL